MVLVEMDVGSLSRKWLMDVQSDDGKGRREGA